MNRSLGRLAGLVALLVVPATGCIKIEAIADDSVTTVRAELLLGQAVEVSAGGLHSCARLQTGVVMCWGRGTDGELGYGGAFSSGTPVPVANLVDAVSISAGQQHTCAVRATGQVVCWGRGAEGQLGNGNSGALTPVTVAGLVDAVAVAAGGGHTCALRASGGVACWGNNQAGQLGNGEFSDFGGSSVPVAVSGLSDATSVSAGAAHTCARRTNGSVVCWGAGDLGQLGVPGDTPPPASSPVPIAVFGLTDVVGRPAASAFVTCAVRATGQVACWGTNIPDQVGASVTPAVVANISDAVSVTVGDGHACALRQTGGVVCWNGGARGQLGNGTTTTTSPTPVAVSDLSNAVAISAGDSHTCALRAAGGVVCWGNGVYDQLGDGRFFTTTTPTEVSGVVDAGAVASGDNHSCVLRFNGQVACWGTGTYGQLGPGTSTPSLTEVTAYAPIVVAGLSNATSVSGGDKHTCAVRATGEITCWGSNSVGQLGDGTFGFSTALVTVAGISDALGVAAGQQHTCAVRANGTVACWGRGEDGELGDGTATTSYAPVTVSDLSDATAVAMGRSHACALRATGSVACWGANGLGQLGNGSLALSPVPVAVSNLSDAIAIASGDSTICALRATGGVVCWGEGEFGQLGNGNNGTFSDSSAPVAVSGLTDAVAIAVGKRHACAVRATGAAVCWGHGGYGQLGNGQAVSSAVPVPVSGLSDAASISAGIRFTCSRRRNAAIVCWGDGIGGELGNGFLPIAVTPVAVVLPDDDVGRTCSDGSECSRGFCVDGRCCADACSGGATDCQACSIEAGGNTNGTCTAVTARACASDGNACTVDHCDGTSRTCQHTPGNAGTICSNIDACESTEVCDGANTSCPAATTLPPDSCIPVTSGDTMLGFLGWDESADVASNPAGSVLLIVHGLRTPGTATVVKSSVGPDLPAGFQTVGADHPHYWHIETNATYDSLTVCMRYDTGWLGSSNELMLQLWHYNTADGIFKDETNTGFPDTSSHVICGDVTKLSPFALVLPIDTTPPILPVPPDVSAYATSNAGAAVNYTVPTATDAIDTSPQVGCTPASGSIFPPGKTTVTCTATDGAGNTATTSFAVWVKYQAPVDGTFFLQPINADGSSLFKRGSTIPVKFKLQGASAGITNLVARLSVAKVSNGVVGPYTPAEATAACDGNTFRYDAASKQYIFNLSTKGLTAGTWSLRAELGDLVDHVVRATFK